MSRSQQGALRCGRVAAAAAAAAQFAGKRVLDLGCGYGWHCIYAAEGGARSVLGNRHLAEDARGGQGEDGGAAGGVPPCRDGGPRLPRRELRHSVKLFWLYTMCATSARWRKDRRLAERWRGPYVFSVEHPVFTAEGSQDWYYDGEGKILHFPVDNYYYEGERMRASSAKHVVYHRTLTTYLDTLLQNGLSLRRIVGRSPRGKCAPCRGWRTRYAAR